MDNSFNTIIIGAGASGLMCASKVSSATHSTFVMEHNKSPGKKILISGGGRCNFTNINTTSDNYLCRNPHFIKAALKQYSPQDFIQLIKAYKVPFFEKKLGQLFCKKSAADIVMVLEQECLKNKVTINYNMTIKTISKEKGLFQIETNKGSYSAKNLVLATGGLSLPQIGASNFGHTIAKQFGHKLIDTNPALVPLKNPLFSQLAGISLIVEIRINQHLIKEDILFTHKGLSGPVILKASLFYKPGDHLLINWLPQLDLNQYLIEQKNSSNKKTLGNVLGQFLPKKVISHFTSAAGIDEKIKLAEMANKKIIQFSLLIHQFKYVPLATEGYNKAEVTAGGVDTDEISSQTLESKLCSGLYFTGEVLDVTGQLGGYNFQWCWASANLAAKAIAQSNTK